jgi:hypothetical protein
MKGIYLILILLFLIQQMVISQINYVVKGIVIEKVTGKPLSDVNIQILPKSRFGCITNENGKFFLTTNKDTLILKFSSISYESKIVKINTKSIPDSGLNILLNPQIHILDEVVINEERFKTIYKKHNESVIDYEIYEHRIYFIVKDYHNLKAKVFSIDESLSDTIYSNPPCEPKELIIDFYGNLDLISRSDSVYQLFLKKEHISYLKPFSFSKLSELNKLYDFKIDSNYYFSEFETIVKDKVNYGLINKNGKKIFCSLFDDNKIDYYYHELRFLKIITPSNYAPQGKRRREIVTKYYSSPRLYLDKKWFYNNISNIFFHIQDTIYIIDNLKNKLLKFDKIGNFISETEITCYTNDNKACSLLDVEGGFIWKNKAVFDICNTEKAYFFWKKGAKTDFYSINLSNGKIEFIKTLPHIFPKKIRIYNNKLYYLYQKPDESRSHGLFRTKIN